MHISLSGRLGAGKSEISRILHDKYGYEIYGTGSAARKIAADLGMTALEFNGLMDKDPKYDRMIDEETHRVSVERRDDKILYDSRMAWHFAENTFRVYVYVDPREGARRIYLDQTRGKVEEYRDLDDALEQTKQRMITENTRFRKKYGVDNFDLANFDLVVDTTSRPSAETAEIILREFEVFCKDPAAYPGKRLLDGFVAL